MSGAEYEARMDACMDACMHAAACVVWRYGVAPDAPVAGRLLAWPPGPTT